jgi:hypothetical protein
MDHFIWNRTAFMGSDMRVELYNTWYGLQNASMMSGCAMRRCIGVMGTEFFNENFAPMFNNTNCKCMRRAGLMNSV